MGSVGSIMDDWPTEFQKDYLKTILLIFTLFFPVSTAMAYDDCYQEMPENDCYNYEPEEFNYTNYGDYYYPETNYDFEESWPENEEYGEVYSWDNLYL